MAQLKITMSSLSEEEENYVRMSLMLTGLSPRAVRALFDREFPPTYLPSTLNHKYNKLLSLQKSRVINQAQWNLLFPLRSGVADSKTFDVTLMICLIRNLTSVTPPVLGFDRLPSTGETTPGADLARIKYYRNYLAHLDDNKIDNSDFTTAWNDISDAVGRLGGASLYQESQALKTKTLDQSNREIMLEVQNLKRSHGCLQDYVDTKLAVKTEEIKKLKTSHHKCTREIETLKDTVPWNIREQTTTELENWKEKDKMFVETCAASHVLQCIKTNSCVTVTGSSGVGKTFTVRHVAVRMAADGYDILPVTEPEDIVKFNNPKKKTLYVIDDLCGTYTLNQTYLDKWKTTHENIKKLLKNDGTKIIVSCRLQVYQDEQFKLLQLFTSCECNLLLPNMSLSNHEKQLITEKYLKSDASKISQYIDSFDFFPLLCKLYHDHQALNVVDFFKNPFSVYEKEVDKLKTEKAHGKYCSLALCVMFNNHLKEEWLTDDVNRDIKQIIEETCEACRLNRSTSRLVLKDELDSLIHTFLKKEKGCYRTIHDKLFDFLSFYFGKTIIACIIKHGDCRLISERLLFNLKAGSDQFTTIVPDKYQKLYNLKADSDQFTTIVPDKYQKMYIERMLDDWSKGEVIIVFTNINMKIPEFRNTFLMYLKGLDIKYQKQLATKCDNTANTHARALFMTDDYDSMDTPLLHCCTLGDINMVQWCCSYGADVNYCSNSKESPFYIACKGGYTDIVTKLVKYKADINKCTWWGESPLYIACNRGYTDIVTKLVDHKADINMCTSWGKESPLYIACKGGYIDIVTKLVDNNADINMCTGYGESPLYIACAGGYTDIVTKLVDNMADINMCKRNNRESPLYKACAGGYTDIVTKLMDNKADINMCTMVGESPLYIACEGGYIDIVTKLVDNQADINMGRDDGESPLYIACKGGFTDIVTKLVNNKADINMCTKRGESPLYIACKGGYTDVVTKLVDNKADINKCTQFDESPLYKACKGGFTDIVTKLVDNKADINLCNWIGESPLSAACRGGYIDIFNKLVDNKADINMRTSFRQSPLYSACVGGYTDLVNKLLDNQADINMGTYDGESPLYKACKGGYTDIVTKLVDKKADINMCTKWGESPLYIACKEGYTDIATKLVENKADINLCTWYGESPLSIACEGGYTDIVNKLVNNMADINMCTWKGESPLYTACEGGYTDIVNKLVDNKADINLCTRWGESPLYIACKGGFTEILNKLLDNKADINKYTKYGSSPLYIACKGGNADIVTKLLDKNADINTCTLEGASPFYIACKQGFFQTVKILIAKGADQTICDKKGQSPLDIARLCGHHDIVEFITQNSLVKKIYSQTLWK